MSNIGYFRAKGTMTMENLAKAIIKLRHSYFFSHYIYFPKIIGDTMFQLSRILRYNYNLRPSIN